MMPYDWGTPIGIVIFFLGTSVSSGILALSFGYLLRSITILRKQGLFEPYKHIREERLHERLDGEWITTDFKGYCQTAIVAIPSR